jgi:hypothetical protein
LNWVLYSSLMFLHVIFLTNCTKVIDPFLLQPTLLTKVGVEGIILGTYKGIVFPRIIVLSITFLGLLGEVCAIMKTYTKVKWWAKTNVVWGCSYN